MHGGLGEADAEEGCGKGLVADPGRAAFQDIISKPDEQEGQKHREGGLADTVLNAMAPAPAFMTTTLEEG